MTQMERAIKDLKFRRRREAVTDYKRRMKLVRGGFERVVVRRSNRMVIGQVVRYDSRGDMIIARADSKELAEFGWPARANRATAYLTGVLLGRKLNGKKGSYILDIGLARSSPSSIPFAFGKGCVDGGMNIKGTFSINDSFYNCAELSKYAAGMKKEDPDGYKNRFSSYIKEGIDPASLEAKFASVKEKLLKNK